MKVFLLLTILLVSSYAQASRKTDFVTAVRSQCGKSEADATKFATPGRSGSVMKFVLCASLKIVISGDCIIKCSKNSGNVVGE